MNKNKFFQQLQDLVDQTNKELDGDFESSETPKSDIKTSQKSDLMVEMSQDNAFDEDTNYFSEEFTSNSDKKIGYTLSGVGINADMTDKIDKKSNVKHFHIGRRKRVKKAVMADPDFMTFSDHEVLEYMLYSTIPRIDTNEIAHLLIQTFGSFSGVLNATINELMSIPCISEKTAIMLTSVVAAARKAEISRLRNNVKISTAGMAVEFLQPFFQNRNTEYVYLISIDNNDRVINVDLISIGDTNFASFNIKKIIETACRHKATKVVVAHNHPAGSLVPSQDDRDLTIKLTTALLSMGINILDHIIFTSRGYYSFYMGHEFEPIYARIDKMFKTNILREMQVFKTSYEAGYYFLENNGSITKKERTPFESELIAKEEKSGKIVLDRSQYEYKYGHPSLDGSTKK